MCRSCLRCLSINDRLESGALLSSGEKPLEDLPVPMPTRCAQTAASQIMQFLFPWAQIPAGVWSSPLAWVGPGIETGTRQTQLRRPAKRRNGHTDRQTPIPTRPDTSLPQREEPARPSHGSGPHSRRAQDRQNQHHNSLFHFTRKSTIGPQFGLPRFLKVDFGWHPSERLASMCDHFRCHAFEK
jgi:hypothetical protein